MARVIYSFNIILRIYMCFFINLIICAIIAFINMKRLICDTSRLFILLFYNSSFLWIIISRKFLELFEIILLVSIIFCSLILIYLLLGMNITLSLHGVLLKWLGLKLILLLPLSPIHYSSLLMIPLIIWHWHWPTLSCLSL